MMKPRKKKVKYDCSELSHNSLSVKAKVWHLAYEAPYNQALSLSNLNSSHFLPCSLHSRYPDLLGGPQTDQGRSYHWAFALAIPDIWNSLIPDVPIAPCVLQIFT